MEDDQFDIGHTCAIDYCASKLIEQGYQVVGYGAKIERAQ